MAHKTQAIETKHKNKDQKRKPAEAQNLRSNNQSKGPELVLSEVIDGGQPGGMAAQSNPLVDLRLPSAQRQALVGQMGQLMGNQHLQRMMSSLAETDRSREGDQPAGAVAAVHSIQRDDGDDAGGADSDTAEAPASNMSRLDEMLDQWNVPEDEVIDLLGQLDSNDKATVIDPRNGYKDKIASALNEDEMTQALNNLQPPLTTKLQWMAAAAGGASSLDYNQIQPMITAAPEETYLLHSWRDFFVDVCDNTTIMTAVTDLGWDLVTKLDWIRAEVFSARLELDYATLAGLITSATQIERDALITNEWRDFFVEVCNNETMQQAVVDLGWHLPTKLEWLIAEGVNIEEDIITEITGVGAPERNALLADTIVMNYLRDNLEPLEFWRVQLILAYGDQASFPGPVLSVYGALSSGPDVTGLRSAIQNMSQADLDLLKGVEGLYTVLEATLSEEDYTFVRRMIDEGLLAEQTGVTREVSEDLLVPGAGGNFEERHFASTGGFDVAYYRDRLQVTVRVKLEPMNEAAAAQLPAAQSVWETNIENAWNGFNVTNDQRTLPINFDIQFTDSNPHHTVTVHPDNPVGWPSVDMTNWWTGSLGTPAHEFGHMVGNPDEYYLSSDHFAVVTGQNPATAAAKTVTSETAGTTTRYSSNASIMGFSGSVQPRHLQYFIDWLNENRMKNPDNTFTEPEFRLGT